MCIKVLKLILIVSLAMWHFGAGAQNDVNSPYSRYGLGDIRTKNFATLQSMGGISTGFSDPYYTNLSNPASLAELAATSFEIGFNAYITTLNPADEAIEPESSRGGNLTYFSLAFPLLNPLNRLLDRKSQDFSWGMGFALLPYSRVNHFSRYEEVLPDIGRVLRESEGSGGTNKVVWSNGLRYKHWSAGISLGYLFGNIREEKAVLYRDLPLAFANYFRNDASYRGLLFTAGMQYKLDLSGGKGKENPRDVRSITFGISTSAGTKFSTLSSDFRALKGVNPFTAPFQGLSDEFPDEVTDTISFVEDLDQRGKLAGDLSIGAVYYKGTKWILGTDLNLINGSKYQNDLDDDQLSNAYRFSFGFQLVPDATSYNNYLKRVGYRGGIGFGTDPRMINNNQIKQFDLNVGIGLPVVVSRQLSFINLGLNYSRQGGNIPIKESVLGFNLGVTLNNNLWFLKRKFD
jgi:hypothetical protein